MAKLVYIIGTADTKLDELIWLRHCLQTAKVKAKIIDVSTSKNPYPIDSNIIDVVADLVAQSHPAGKKAIFSHSDCGKAISAMSVALTYFLHDNIENIAGVLGIGGSGGTALITPAMQALPIGIPKIMVSTMASGNVSGYVGGCDIAMLYTVTDLSGLNRVSRSILANAANMMAGSVKHTAHFDAIRRPALALTMFGVTTPCINQLTARLSPYYDSLVFHATGNGGMSMEKLISQGEIAGVLDITLTEIADFLFGGVLACSATRLDCIAKTKIPWIGSAGALDMVNFGSWKSIPECYAHRLFAEHNSQVTLMRTSVEENYQLGVWIGNKLNRCDGLVRFIIPEGGFSALDCVGQPFYLPAATEAFSKGLEDTVDQTNARRIIKTPYHINSQEFCSQVAEHFQEIMQY